MESSRLAVSLVIPAYNEGRRLAATLDEVLAYLRQTPWNWTVHVVDDGSTDDTAALAERYRQIEPRVVVQRAPHGGKGAAVKAGLLAARGEYRFICDADLSMPIREVERFLPPHVTGADIAIATRQGSGARRIGEPLRRHVVGRVFNALVQWLLLPGLEDTQCGFKMFTARAVEQVFPRLSVDGWSFDIEALYLARRQGLRIVEVPIEWHYRAESHLNVLRDGPAMFMDLLRIRRNAKLGRRPPPDKFEGQ
jgi:glycosyltransferase involved in cell wall biosynthesis